MRQAKGPPPGKRALLMLEAGDYGDKTDAFSMFR